MARGRKRPERRKTLDKLTAEQTKLAEIVKQEWQLKIFSTDPVNRRNAEQRALDLYASLGIKKPPFIVWADSNFAGMMMASFLWKLQSPGTTNFSHRNWEWDEKEIALERALSETARFPSWSSQHPDRMYFQSLNLAYERVRDQSPEYSRASWASGWRQVLQFFSKEVLGDQAATHAELRAVGRSLSNQLLETMRARTEDHDTFHLSIYTRAHSFAYIDFLTRLGFIGGSFANALLGLARTVFMMMPLPRAIVLVERPTVMKWDFANSRFHSDDGPALAWRDKSEFYFVNGVRVPKAVVSEPGSITVEMIQKEANAEVSRIMLEKFGIERYITESNARMLHEDECGKLYAAPYNRNEELRMVSVVNSTPEPDGTNKVYWLRVPPEMRTAREAVAWTFNMREQDYVPLQQT